VVFLAVVSASIAEFSEWMQQHNKHYATVEEFHIRRANFDAAKKRIAQKNAKSPSATFALNKFSDLSEDEFRAMYLSQVPLHTGKRDVITPKKTAPVPATFDWRNKGAVTRVKNQEQCGSCWAFSVTENVESVWILAGHANNTIALSPQQIVDCDTVDQGCNGGDPPSAYQYIQNAGGLESEANYPYTAQDGNCNFNSADVVASITGFKYACDEYDEKTLQSTLLNVAPVSICVDAAYWSDYQSGILTAWECAWINQLDHCVQLVGYNTTSSTPYWIVRNSWGTDWGVNGYIWLQMWDNACGLTNEATTATSA